MPKSELGFERRERRGAEAIRVQKRVLRASKRVYIPRVTTEFGINKTRPETELTEPGSPSGRPQRPRRSTAQGSGPYSDWGSVKRL